MAKTGNQMKKEIKQRRYVVGSQHEQWRVDFKYSFCYLRIVIRATTFLELNFLDPKLGTKNFKNWNLDLIPAAHPAGQPEEVEGGNREMILPLSCMLR